MMTDTPMEGDADKMRKVDLLLICLVGGLLTLCSTLNLQPTTPISLMPTGPVADSRKLSRFDMSQYCTMTTTQVWAIVALRS